jgi:hypothetical protein
MFLSLTKRRYDLGCAIRIVQLIGYLFSCHNSIRPTVSHLCLADNSQTAITTQFDVESDISLSTATHEVNPLSGTVLPLINPFVRSVYLLF